MATPEQQAAFEALDFNAQVRLAGMMRGVPLNPAEVDALFRTYARAHYGAMAAYLDHPEIGPLLSTAARGGWSSERLTNAVQETNFWKTTIPQIREYDLLSRTDPAAAQARVEAMATTIATYLAQAGAELPEARINELALQLVRTGTEQELIPRMVLAEVDFNPTVPQAGRLGGMMTQVQQLADQYGLPMSDQTAFQQAKDLAMGLTTEDGITELMRINAQASYAHLADRISSGYTVRQILDPQIATAAQLLGRDASQIDIRDPKWAELVAYDPGNGQVRERNLSETAKYVKQQDEYWIDNQQAEDEVAQKVTMLAQAMGRK